MKGGDYEGALGELNRAIAEALDTTLIRRYAHDADSALELCMREVYERRRRMFVLQYPYYDGRRRYCAYTGARLFGPDLFEVGDTAAEALARLALAAIRTIDADNCEGGEG